MFFVAKGNLFDVHFKGSKLNRRVFVMSHSAVRLSRFVDLSWSLDILGMFSLLGG